MNCGYIRDGTYNSRQANYTGRQQRGAVIHWRGGKILVGRGLARDDKGTTIKPYRVNDPVSVVGMKAHDFMLVARHLAPFVDALENNVRHQVKALEDAAFKVQEMLRRIENDPMPSDEPAQMSEDPDVEVPEEASE